jgi:hypothetical protein
MMNPSTAFGLGMLTSLLLIGLFLALGSIFWRSGQISRQEEAQERIDAVLLPAGLKELRSADREQLAVELVTARADRRQSEKALSEANRQLTKTLEDLRKIRTAARRGNPQVSRLVDLAAFEELLYLWPLPNGNQWEQLTKLGRQIIEYISTLLGLLVQADQQIEAKNASIARLASALDQALPYQQACEAGNLLPRWLGEKIVGVREKECKKETS